MSSRLHFLRLEQVEERLSKFVAGEGCDELELEELKAALRRAWPFDPSAPLSPLEIRILIAAIEKGRIGRDDSGRTFRELAAERRRLLTLQ